MGPGAAVNLPPLPPGAKLAPAGGGLPPLPPGATLSGGGGTPSPATPSAATTTPPQDGGGLGGWLDKNVSNPDGPAADQGAWGVARGGIKSAGQLLGNVLDFISKPSGAEKVGSNVVAPTQQKVTNHLQDAAHWLQQGNQPEGFWENVGAAGEQVLEFIGTDGLLKMVGSGAKVARTVEAGSRVVETTEQLKQAQQVAATLSKNPKIAGLVALGLKASKDATMMAGQTYAHTEDPAQAAEAGAFGGAVSGGVGLASRYLAKIAPKALTIAGEEMPALASQVNEAGQPMDTGARGAPAVARAQQEAAQNVIRNTAAQATAQALDKINQTRPAYSAIEDTSRMLPAGEGADPFKFTLEGSGATETPTGKIAQSAAQESQAAFKQPRFQTSSAPTRSATNAPGGRIVAGEEGGMGADIRTAATPEAAGEVVGGGGNLQTTDPGEAEGWLRQLEDIQASPEHDRLPQAQQDAIEGQRQKLTEQLGLYHSSPYAQRFAPVDIGAAAGSVRTFGDAATQIEAAAKPVYNTLDRVSGGDFNKWKEVAKRQVSVMRNPSSEEAFQGAQSKYREAQSEINDIIDRNRGQVSTQDYMTAKNAWRDSSRLDELHNVFEGMMNGVTVEESDQGLTRVMTGRAKRLENYLAEGTNREQMEQLIGKDGVTNLKQITLLLSKANTARTTQDVAKNTLSEMYGHARMGGAGGAIGGMVAHAMGLPWYEGMAAGATSAEAVRMVLRYAATSPRVGNMVDYAVRNGLSPQHYAPLIARTIAAPFQQQPQKEEAPDAQ